MHAAAGSLHPQQQQHKAAQSSGAPQQAQPQGELEAIRRLLPRLSQEEEE